MSMLVNAAKWSPDSWRAKPILQMPDYPDAKALADVEAQLATFPPLVFAGEARNLKKALAQGRGRRGFPAARRRLRRKLCRARRQQYPRLLPPLSADGGGADLCRGLPGGESRPHRRPIRQAAHLADRKARRRRTAGLSRRHHQRHRIHAPRRARPIRAGNWRPIGSRRRRSICCAPSPPAATPICRMRINGCCRFVKDSPQSKRYQDLPTVILPRRSTSCAPAASIPKCIRKCARPISYTSHEALLLGYEQAFTRVDSTTGDWYCTSGHMVWIGDRTRQPDHAHVEYCRGIKNPLGLKTGPTQKPDELLKLIDILDPDNEPGRLTLICRVGADKVADLLPADGARGQARRPQRGVVVRSDARQHHHLGHRLQDPAVRPDPQGGARLLPGLRRRGHLCRRRASGNDRPERHRMHRRRARHQRRGSQRPLSHGLRPAAQCRAVARSGVPAGRPAQIRARGQDKTNCPRSRDCNWGGQFHLPGTCSRPSP